MNDVMTIDEIKKSLERLQWHIDARRRNAPVSPSISEMEEWKSAIDAYVRGASVEVMPAALRQQAGRVDEAGYVFLCSNPACRAVHIRDPHGPCHVCLAGNGGGWSTTRQRLYRNGPDRYSTEEEGEAYMEGWFDGQAALAQNTQEGPGEEDGPWAEGWAERSSNAQNTQGDAKAMASPFCAACGEVPAYDSPGKKHCACARLHAARSRVPDGWALVPIRSTDEMHQAYTRAKYDGEKPVLIQNLWAAMVAAAPSQPKDAGMTLEQEVKILRVKCAGSLANNLCPDHRDKQSGKPCLACTIEKLGVDAQRLKDFIKLCGYVENGSDTVVKLFQDDATRSWFVKIGERSWFGDTARQAMDQAIEWNKKGSDPIAQFVEEVVNPTVKATAWCPKCAANQPHHTDPNSSGCLHLCDVCNGVVEY